MSLKPPRSKGWEAEFLKIWNTDKSSKEIAEHFGVSEAIVNNLAFKLRKNGMKLVPKKVGRPLGEISRVIAEYRKNGSVKPRGPKKAKANNVPWVAGKAKKAKPRKAAKSEPAPVPELASVPESAGDA